MFTINHLSNIPSQQYAAMFYLNETTPDFACRYFNDQTACYEFLDRLWRYRRAGVMVRDDAAAGGWRLLTQYIHQPKYMAVADPAISVAAWLD